MTTCLRKRCLFFFIVHVHVFPESISNCVSVSSPFGFVSLIYFEPVPGGAAGDEQFIIGSEQT